MTQTAEFSSRYRPPAPVLPVRLATPEEAAGQQIETALIDTGADGTFIPIHLLEELGLPAIYLTTVRSHFNEVVHSAAVYKVDLILFEALRLPNIEVVGDDFGEQIILGRNVLNHLRLVLDGPTRKIFLNE